MGGLAWGCKTDDMIYRHVQWGWTWLPYLIFALVVGGITVAGAGESDDEESAWVIALTVVLLVAIFVVVLLFSRLEVTVDSENVTAAFGFGWPKKVVALDDIVSVREVRNAWWQGWASARSATVGCTTSGDWMP